MKRIKTNVMFFAAILLYQAASFLFDAAQKEHRNTCPNHAKERSNREARVN